MHVSYSEIKRMVPNALRMAGLPLAQADEIAEMIAWTEVAVGDALSFIRQYRYKLAENPSLRINSTDEGELIDCESATLLQFGIRIFDYLQAEAAIHGKSKIFIKNFEGTIFVPYLALRLANAGFDCFVWEKDDYKKESENSWVVRSWLFSNPPSLNIQLSDVHGNDIELGSAARILLEQQAALRDGSRYLVVQCCLNSFYRNQTHLLQSLARKKVLAPTGNMGNHIWKGVNQGIEISNKDYEVFKELAAKIQVESSESSRTQAG